MERKKGSFTQYLLLGSGLAIIATSVIKWVFLRPGSSIDYSQLGFGILIGFGFVFGYWVHRRFIELNEKIEDFDRALDASRIWTVDEVEKINAKLEADKNKPVTT